MEREEVRDARPGQRTTRCKRQLSGARQPTTLRGVFPDRPIVYERNFIKENVRRVKQFRRRKANENINENDKPNAQISTALSKLKLGEVSTSEALPLKRATGRQEVIPKLGINAKRNQPQTSNFLVINNISHRSMQTELSDDLAKIYSTGVIKYPSMAGQVPTNNCNGDANVNHIATPKDQGPTKKEDASQNTNFIRNNILALTKSRIRATTEVVDPPSKSHDRRSKILKPAKWRKDPIEEVIIDEDCPSGHVLLPEEERNETLRVLQETYAQKIQELNLMPVRNDTLKMQKRKMDLELELKKIDEGIKVFQRPKVYVKIDA